MSTRTGLTRSLSICLVLGAAALPATAGARAIHPGDPAFPPAPPQTSHHGAPTAAAAPADDFRWDDAGIGAADAVVLLGAGGAATVSLRRRHAHQPVAG